MSKILFAIQFIWQLPQNIVALLILAFNTKYLLSIKPYKVNVALMTFDRRFFITGVSLGNYILLNQNVIETDKFVIDHEYHHTRQSLLFGWLYLIVVGIKSYYNHCQSRNNPKYQGNNYYTHWPENDHIDRSKQ